MRLFLRRIFKRIKRNAIFQFIIISAFICWVLWITMSVLYPSPSSLSSESHIGVVSNEKVDIGSLDSQGVFRSTLKVDGPQIRQKR